MKKLLIATKNQAKMRDLAKFLSDLPVELVSLADVAITEDVAEDGLTYEENSQKKALFYAKKSGLPAIADDGGLEIVALNGEPGVRSRRWLGHEATDEELIAHLEKIAKTLPDDNRVAFFKTVMSVALPDGKIFSVACELKGMIAKEGKLEKENVKGYPFRTFFYLPQLGKFVGEMTEEEMKKYNHRYLAIQELKLVLMRELSLR